MSSILSAYSAGWLATKGILHTLVGHQYRYVLLCAGGGAAASDIHGLKTGAQYLANTTSAETTTGPTAPSTVPATAGYSGMLNRFASLMAS